MIMFGPPWLHRGLLVYCVLAYIQGCFRYSGYVLDQEYNYHTNKLRRRDDIIKKLSILPYLMFGHWHTIPMDTSPSLALFNLEIISTCSCRKLLRHWSHDISDHIRHWLQWTIELGRKYHIYTFPNPWCFLSCVLEPGMLWWYMALESQEKWNARLAG